METIKKYNTGYTQVLNEVLYDCNLSLRAKGIYAYLFSKPDGWQFHISVMEKELKESKGQIYSAIKELVEFGYVKRYQSNVNGVFGGMIYEFLDVRNRDTDIPCMEKHAYGSTPSLNNTDILNNINILNNTDINKRKFRKPEIKEIQSYCLERKNNINAEQFYDFYESKGWKVGNSPMKDWKACVRTWERGRKIANKTNYFCNEEGVPY